MKLSNGVVEYDPSTPDSPYVAAYSYRAVPRATDLALCGVFTIEELEMLIQEARRAHAWPSNSVG